MNKRGFSLLELVLAIAIFSLGSVALATMLIDANLSTRLATDRTEALFYAKEGISAVRSLRDNSWASLTNGEHGLDNSSAPPFFSGSSDEIDSKYTRVVTVSEISSSTKNIAINISWDLTPARIASTTLETVLTDWKQ